MMIFPEIDAIHKAKAEVAVLESKKQQLVGEIKELEVKDKGKYYFLIFFHQSLFLI